jgi:hypothetical protein
MDVKIFERIREIDKEKIGEYEKNVGKLTQEQVPKCFGNYLESDKECVICLLAHSCEEIKKEQAKALVEKESVDEAKEPVKKESITEEVKKEKPATEVKKKKIGLPQRLLKELTADASQVGLTLEICNQRLNKLMEEYECSDPKAVMIWALKAMVKADVVKNAQDLLNEVKKNV